MPMSSSTLPKNKESMYFYMLAKELDDLQRKFLTRAIFTNQEALLQSVDLTNFPHLVTKTDVAANDRDFICQLTELLRESQNLKIDPTVQDDMLQSLYKQSSSKNSSAQYKICFIEGLLAERKFFINLIRSLLRIVNQVVMPSGKDLGKPTTTIPVFQNDPFLEEEFQKVTQARSQSSLNAPTQSVSKKYPIQRLLQPTAGGQTNTSASNADIATKGLSSRDLLAGASDLILNETPADLTTYSAKQPQQATSMTQKLFASAAATKTSLFNKFQNQSQNQQQLRLHEQSDSIENGRLMTSEIDINDEYNNGASGSNQNHNNLHKTATINRVIHDKNLGLSTNGGHKGQNRQSKQQSQQFHHNNRQRQLEGGCFSFAEGFKEVAVNNGVYMAEGNRVVGCTNLEPKSDMASNNSPSFGNTLSSSKLTKSPHSQNAVVRQSTRKKSVLNEYNHLFKRKEIVQLKHKWETDDEDVGADVTDSSQTAEEDDNDEEEKTAAHSAGGGSKHGNHRRQEHMYKGNNKLSGGAEFEEDMMHHQKVTNHHHHATKSVNTRRVQKPDQKQIVIGKRANVRTSNKCSKLLSTNSNNNQRQSNSRSPNRKQQVRQGLGGTSQQAQQAQSNGLLFSQNKNKKASAGAATTAGVASGNQASLASGSQQPAQTPSSMQQQQQSLQQHQSQQNKKITSRNLKRSDLYTKSVPSLTTEKPKTKEMTSTVASGGDNVDKKATKKLLKDASFALAMTMSPKSQSKTTGPIAGTKKIAIANPQYTSSANFERTYQSLSSQKKVIKAAASRSNSSNCSNKDGGSESHQHQQTHHQQQSAAGGQKKQRQPRIRKTSSSPYRYNTKYEEYKESMCEPNELVQQLKQEQEFEYASLPSNSNHHQQLPNKGGKSCSGTSGGGDYRQAGSPGMQHQPQQQTTNGTLMTMDVATSKDSRIGSKWGISSNEQQSSKLLALHEQASSEPDEYELNRTDKRKLTTGTSKNQHMRVKSNLNLSKQSQSKLLPTSNGQITVEEQRPTQPKKLEKDAKQLLFPPSQSGHSAKKSMIVGVGKQHHTMAAQTTANHRRNSEYKGCATTGSAGSSNQHHQVYQVKSVRGGAATSSDKMAQQQPSNSSVPVVNEVANPNSGGGSVALASSSNHIQQPGVLLGGQNTRYTSDGSKQSPKIATAHQANHTMSNASGCTNSNPMKQKLNSHRAALPSSIMGNSSSSQLQKRLSKSGKRAIESIDSKHSGADKRSPDANHHQHHNSGNLMMIQQSKYESKVKQVVTQLAELEKRTNKASSSNCKSTNQKTASVLSWQQQQQQSFQLQNNSQQSRKQGQRQQQNNSNSIHNHNLEHHTNESQQNPSQHHRSAGVLNNNSGGSSQPGAYPVLQDSCIIKSSAGGLPQDSSAASGKPKAESDMDADNSCYDNDYDEDQDDMDALNKANKASNGMDDGLARYTQEIMQYGDLANRTSNGIDSSILEDGPQTFDKEESEDFDGMRQQIFFVNNDSVNCENSNAPGKVQIAQNLNEPAESERSLPGRLTGSNKNRTQCLNKPSESLAQSYQHDDNYQEMEDFDDQDALFEHLNASDTNRDVSFNLENMSQIRQSNNQAADLSSSHGGGMVPIKNFQSNSSRQNAQFSVHSQLDGQQQNQLMSQGTHSTIKSTKQKQHNMLIKGTIASHQGSNNSGVVQARPPLSKHTKGTDHVGSYNSKANSNIRSVSIDLLDQQSMKGGGSSMPPSSQPPAQLSATQQQPKFRLGMTTTMSGSSGQAQHQVQQSNATANNITVSSKEDVGAPQRNQTITQTSQDIYSEDSVPNQTESQQNYPQNTNAASNNVANNQSYPDGGNGDNFEQNNLSLDDQLEDAERSHRLSQVRMELYRAQEIRNARKPVFQNRHMSSSSSDRSCSSQVKQQLRAIKRGSQEQSPSTKQQRLRKDRRKLFFGVDSSERDDEEQEQEYGANDSNAVQEYTTIVNVNKPKSKKATQALASLKAASSPGTTLRDKRASNDPNHEHYFGVNKMANGGSDQDISSAGAAGLSQEDLDSSYKDSSYNNFLVKQRTRRLGYTIGAKQSNTNNPI